MNNTAHGHHAEAGTKTMNNGDAPQIERVIRLIDDPRISYANFIGAKVLKRSRVNTLVEITVRFSPTGPWYTQQHRIPNFHILETRLCAE